MTDMQPKVFISYSWTDQHHQDCVREWAERLVNDGIQVVMDIFDLKEGDDKYAFMERMVTDASVTHVLVFCDKHYAEKADTQKGSSGVGTESQIISSELYSKVTQSKFIPIYCEINPDGSPCVPVFLKSRIGIEFSTFEKSNENWEKLIRLLYGKPLYVKPVLGKAPAYITSPVAVSMSSTGYKFETLKSALLADRKGIQLCRDDFLSACFEDADRLRIRQQPDSDTFPDTVLETCRTLMPVRNALVDWIYLEGKIGNESALSRMIEPVLEKLRALKGHPQEVSNYNEAWFAAHDIFVYETFLYMVAVLMRLEMYALLHEIFTTSYLCPEYQYSVRGRFEPFTCFWTLAHQVLQSPLKPQPGHQFRDTVGEVVRRQADRTDIPFSKFIEAELLAVLVSLAGAGTDCDLWRPHTLCYGNHNGNNDFFIRATQRKYFNRLAIVTGIKSAAELRNIVQEKLKAYFQGGSFFVARDIWSLWNMDELDSLT